MYSIHPTPVLCSLENPSHCQSDYVATLLVLQLESEKCKICAHNMPDVLRTSFASIQCD